MEMLVVLSRVFEISQNFKDGSYGTKKIQPLAQLLSRHTDLEIIIKQSWNWEQPFAIAPLLYVNCPIHKNAKQVKQENG